MDNLDRPTTNISNNILNPLLYETFRTIHIFTQDMAKKIRKKEDSKIKEIIFLFVFHVSSAFRRQAIIILHKFLTLFAFSNYYQHFLSFLSESCYPLSDGKSKLFYSLYIPGYLPLGCSVNVKLSKVSVTHAGFSNTQQYITSFQFI